MKKFLSIVLCMTMLFPLAACDTQEKDPTPPVTATFKAETYQGEAAGRNGKITVDVALDESKITEIHVTSHTETPVLSDAAINQIPKLIVEGQTLNVDSIAGVTLTCTGILSAVAAALQSAGVDTSTLMAKVEKPSTPVADEETDVVVIGSGAAGMIAAIAVKDAGKNVILVEKQGLLGGGDTMLASTGLTGGGSHLIAKLGIENASAEDYYNKMIKQAETKKLPVDKNAIRAYSLRSGEMIDWLAQCGVPFGRYKEDSSFHITQDGSAPGPHIVLALSRQLAEKKIDYRLNTKATSILMKEGKAVGITVESADGNYTLSAKAVIVCTGGFSASSDLVAEYAPKWVDRPTTGSKALTGDGILMAQKVGADTYNMNQIKANYLCHVTAGGDGVSLTAIAPYCALVNHEGKRFVDEGHASITHKSEVMMEQTNHEAYAIFDETVIEELKLMSGYKDAGYFISADTLEALAEKIEVNRDNFVKTMTDYQKYGKSGIDTEFGRKITDTLENPKYYAARVTPSMQSTYGGIRVDANGRALNAHGKVIDGLYAAGATSGHDAYANEVGYALIIAVAYGRIVGETAISDMK